MRALLVAFAIASCHGEQEQARRAEAGRLAHAIGALREAPNEEKTARIAALERERCSAPELCELKRTCVDAYRSLDQGLQATRVASRALDADADAAAARRVAELVAATERDLRRARELTQRCSELEGESARRYALSR